MLIKIRVSRGIGQFSLGYGPYDPYEHKRVTTTVTFNIFFDLSICKTILNFTICLV
jgi:hypothetical protein